MEPILGELLKFGIGGCMAAAVLFFGWWTATRTIPRLIEAREQDLIWARGQMETLRHEHAALMKEIVDEIETRHSEQLKQQQEATQRMMDSVIRKVEQAVSNLQGSTKK